MDAKAIVLYPAPPRGHLISMVEFGKLILKSEPSLSIHILISAAPFKSGDIGDQIAAFSDSVPSITFHHLPPVSLPPEFESSSPEFETLVFELLRLNKPLVAKTLSSIAGVRALIMDFFCGSALTVAAELNIPSYFYYTSGASSLSLFLYFPTLDRNFANVSFKDLGRDALISIPGVPQVAAVDIPDPILDRNSTSYKCFIECSELYVSRATGIIINTFEALEPRAVKALRDGICIPDCSTPEIHSIGPVIQGPGGGVTNNEYCLSWLDSQPSGSVVFLCFGSLGAFPAVQLVEIAVALEKSGLRFLWVVRAPPPEKKNPEELLPEGFLERTRERGLVVKDWAPQAEVLSHGSVGGFVTHCGWNSVLESVCGGVPMVAWPIYAEQRLNRVVLVEELGIALPMGEGDCGLVRASEIEIRVTELMGNESVRERVLTLKREAELALSDGGSSRVALTRLLESWKV